LKPGETLTRHLWRLFWRVVLAVHAAAAAAWMWVMPGGFPLAHARFWANRALPLLVIVVALAGLFAAWRRKAVPLRLVSLGFAVAWLAAAVTARLVFPISGRIIWLPALLVAAVLGTVACLSFRGESLPLLATGVAVLLAGAVGAAMPLTQRAGASSTRPIDEPLPDIRSGSDIDFHVGPVPLGHHVDVRTREQRATIRCSGLRIDVLPLLTFTSRSPDRCWTILAPREDQMGMPWRLTGMSREGNAVRLLYQGDEAGFLEVSPGSEAGSARIEAFTRLEEPVYSHLNTFCELHISGHRKLALSFSPCPKARIEVLPFDYPVGRPARLAYLDADGRCHVVEARSGEKGPFREVAAGPMEPSSPLAITLYDEGRAACRIVFDDWARQAGTALSPTAGWGLPVNAIEFCLLGKAPSSEAALYITLAATSVGRGWDSVGHAAGTYRNRMRIEPVMAPDDDKTKTGQSVRRPGEEKNQPRMNTN